MIGGALLPCVLYFAVPAATAKLATYAGCLLIPSSWSLINIWCLSYCFLKYCSDLNKCKKNGNHDLKSISRYKTYKEKYLLCIKFFETVISEDSAEWQETINSLFQNSCWPSTVRLWSGSVPKLPSQTMLCNSSKSNKLIKNKQTNKQNSNRQVGRYFIFFV